MLLPEIDKNLNVIAYHERAAIHNPDKPKLHPVVLILAIRMSLGKVFFLIGDKTAKNCKLPQGEAKELYKSSVKEGSPSGHVPIFDCLGGHVEDSDVAGQRKISRKVFYSCAERELKEELLLAKGMESSSPFYMFTCPSPPSSVAEGNPEISKVFCTILPETALLANTHAKMKDSYIDKNGDPVDAPLFAKFVEYDRLLADYKAFPRAYMDGIERILEFFLAEGWNSEDFLQKVSRAKAENSEYEYERYQDLMTRDCADPDDGTLRTPAEVQRSWSSLGFYDYSEDMI